MIGVGAIAAAVGAYVFQVLGGRTLGAEAFGSIAALWTLGFLLHTIVMMTVEQLITRTISFVGASPLPGAVRRQVAQTLILGSIVGVILVAVGLGRFFDSDPVFIGAMAVLMVSRAVTTVGRGLLAGRRRFASYGFSLMLEVVMLTSLGALGATIDGGAVWFGFSLAIAPLGILLVRPFSTDLQESDADEPWTEANSVLPMLVFAAALSQLVLAGGPLIVGLVGGSAAEVSVFFITFTLLRGPITASYGLSTRILADMAAAASRGEKARLHRWALRLSSVGAVGIVVAAIGSYVVLPELISLLYGSEFRPAATIAMLGGGGAVAALTLLFVAQILIAFGRTRDLAVAWSIAVAIATVVLVASNAAPLLRVTYAFAAGEGAAFVLVSAAAMWRSR